VKVTHGAPTALELEQAQGPSAMLKAITGLAAGDGERFDERDGVKRLQLANTLTDAATIILVDKDAIRNREDLVKAYYIARAADILNPLGDWTAPGDVADMAKTLLRRHLEGEPDEDGAEPINLNVEGR
jgi:hypothetical protein